MLRPSKNQILKKVLSHLHNDIKKQYEGAKEDKELSKDVKKEKDRKLLKDDLIRKGVIKKSQTKSEKHKKK